MPNYNGKNIFQFKLKKLLCYSLLSSSIITFPLQADIYFSEKIGGPIVNIHSIDEQGTMTKITANRRWRDVEHSVSVDGLISFSSNRRDAKVSLKNRAPENFNIFILDPIKNKLEQITKQAAQEMQPQFSPSGQKLAFIRTDKKQQSLILYDLNTKKETLLSTSKVLYDFYWSTNNQQIVFTSQAEKSAAITIIDVKTLTSDVIFKAGFDEKSKRLKNLFLGVSWSPDGDNIAYIHHPFTKGISRTLHIYNIDSKKERMISQPEIQVQAPITWSKNSQTLLYSALVNYQHFFDETIHKKVYLGGMHIFHSDLAGNSQQLTRGDHLFKHPIFSPNQDKIAYLYADILQSKTLSLRTMKIDGSEEKTLNSKVFQRANLQWK